MERNITKLYAEYKEGRTDRRTFIKKLTLVAGSTAAAFALLPALAEANDLGSELDEETVSQFIKYPAPKTDVRAFLSHPKKGSKFPAVVVIHENRGLQPHIQEVAKRFAREGFLSLAPDALTSVGGTPENDQSKAGEMMRGLDNDDTINNMVATV